MKHAILDAFDLSNLTHVDQNILKEFVDKLNKLPYSPESDKQTVVALGTGGTIAMKKDKSGMLVPDLNFKRIMQFATPHLQDSFSIFDLDIFSIDSSQMNYTHIKDLAICISYIWKNIRCPIIGFMVLHGTDTMTYSSAAISLMMGQGLPFSIVYTGAQKPIEQPLSDAGTNLQNALYTLESLYKNDIAEVVVVMGDVAILGTSSEKIDDAQVNAFDAPLHKYIARFNRLDYPVKLASWLQPQRKLDFNPIVWNTRFSQTLLVKSYLGLCPEMIARQVSDEQVKAVILYSYGGNTIYEEIINQITPIAEEKKLNIFVVSPVNVQIKANYASTYHMIENRVMPLYMTLSAALAKIEIAIRLFPNDVNKVSEFMMENYVGEIPNDCSRYIPDH